MQSCRQQSYNRWEWWKGVNSSTEKEWELALRPILIIILIIVAVKNHMSIVFERWWSQFYCLLPAGRWRLGRLSSVGEDGLVLVQTPGWFCERWRASSLSSPLPLRCCDRISDRSLAADTDTSSSAATGHTQHLHWTMLQTSCSVPAPSAVPRSIPGIIPYIHSL